MCIREEKLQGEMGFYLDGILRREVKSDRNSKHSGVFNVNLTHTFTSIYVPFTK